MEGIKRLEQEVLEMNDYNISLIFNNIKNRVELQDKFNNKEKTIKKMYKFIYNKARNLAKENVAMVNEKIVYLWAITYFNKTDEELGIKKKENIESPKREIQKKVEIEETPKSNQVSLFEEV